MTLQTRVRQATNAPLAVTRVDADSLSNTNMKHTHPNDEGGLR